MELLLLSNGKTTEHPGLLGWARDRVQTLLARNQVKRILLIPYAVIRSDWDARARELTESLGVDAISIHHFDDPVDAINRADAIFISGGNTWLLNQRLHEYGLVVPIQRAVRERGVPYVGWSAGCNVATPQHPHHQRHAGVQRRRAACAGALPRADQPTLSGRQHQRPHGGDP